MIESWELRDGPFIYFNILNLPYADKSIKIAPLAELNDGLLDIIVSLHKYSMQIDSRKRRKVQITQSSIKPR